MDGSFGKKIDLFSRAIVAREILKFTKKVANDALARLVDKTPVRTGRARGAWLVTQTRRAAGTPDRLDPNGAATQSAGQAVISTILPFQAVFITNNVEYILKLEHGGSDQASEGMMALTVQELAGKYR